MKCFGTKQVGWFVGAVLASTGFDRAADAMQFTLENQSDVVIQRVQAGPDYDEGWRDDLLGSTVLPPGNQRQFDVGGAADHCKFDIRVEWMHGLYRTFMSRNLCEDPHVAFDGGRGLVISNESRTEIAVVQADPSLEDSWGPDRLGGDEIIPPGHERVIMFEEWYKSHCVFDIRLTTLARASAEYRERNLCDDSRIVFFEGNELTIANEGEETIYYIRVSVDHDWGWSHDLLAVEGSLSQGEEFTTRLHQFTEDQCLFDVLVEDERQHVYEDVDICETARLVHPSGANGGTPTGSVVHQEDLAVGETFRDCEGWGCPWMVVVDGGAFKRGSWERDDESPVTNVTVAGPFAVGQFEVSVGQFEEFAHDTGHDGGNGCYVKARRGWGLAGGRGAWRWTEGRSWRDPGFDQDDSHPVVCVSWDDAVAYTRWLAGRTDLPYRLLTEAEAELLATASATKFERSGRANCRNCGSRWDGKGTSPIGRMRPDDLGLTGVFGNAAEWVQDCYQGGYGNTPRDGSAWSPPSCERRVVRGGCWLTSAQKLRASGRDSGESDRRSSCVGFRVARDVAEGVGP